MWCGEYNTVEPRWRNRYTRQVEGLCLIGVLVRLQSGAFAADVASGCMVSERPAGLGRALLREARFLPLDFGIPVQNAGARPRYSRFRSSPDRNSSCVTPAIVRLVRCPQPATGFRRLHVADMALRDVVGVVDKSPTVVSSSRACDMRLRVVIMARVAINPDGAQAGPSEAGVCADCSPEARRGIMLVMDLVCLDKVGIAAWRGGSPA